MQFRAEPCGCERDIGIAELGHVITEHETGPLRLVEITTGETYHAHSELSAARGRIAELEAHIHA